MLTALGAALPRLTDFYMERAMFDAQQSDAPAEPTAGNLYHSAGEEHVERGSYSGHVMRSSIFPATLSPARALLAAGVGLAVFAGIRSLANSGKDLDLLDADDLSLRGYAVAVENEHQVVPGGASWPVGGGNIDSGRGSAS